MSDNRRIRTLLYGDQLIYATELDLLHTPIMQRLYDLHQLGLTDRVFIDASHSRLHHTIGVLAQVDNIIHALVRNLQRGPDRALEYRDQDGARVTMTAGELASYVQSRRRAVRLMALLHDVTHAPFGHTLEDEINYKDIKHDDPKRQADTFYYLLVQYLGWVRLGLGQDVTTPEGPYPDDFLENLEDFIGAAGGFPPKSQAFMAGLIDLGQYVVSHDSVARRIERAPDKNEIRTSLLDLRFAMEGLLLLDSLHKDRLPDLRADGQGGGTAAKVRQYPFKMILDGILEPVQRSQYQRYSINRAPPAGTFWVSRDALFLDVIGNTICADLLDYAKRDSHFAGLKLDYDVDRIVDNFTAVSYYKHAESLNDPTSLEPMIRTAISIFSHKFRMDVPGELMNLLQVRFYVYQRVLYHPTKAIAGAMLGTALQLIGWEELPREFTFIGDAVFLDRILETATLVLAAIKEVSPDRWKEPLSTVTEGEDSITSVLDAIPHVAAVAPAKQLLVDRRADHIGEVITDLTAARNILSRLAARRYNRAVFRLLRDVKLPVLNLDADGIAQAFMSSSRRARTERAIEKAASLPRGSVSIHCPHSDGPRKIAEILILSSAAEELVIRPLRHLKDIDPQLFSDHQAAITAVEDMYRSMWRLVVSIAPPHHSRYEELSDIIGHQLYAELDHNVSRRSSHVPNDLRKLRELEDLATRKPTVSSHVDVVFPDGSRTRREGAYIALADALFDRLRKIEPAVGNLLEDPELQPTDDLLEGVVLGLIKRFETTDQALADMSQRGDRPDNHYTDHEVEQIARRAREDLAGERLEALGKSRSPEGPFAVDVEAAIARRGIGINEVSTLSTRAGLTGLEAYFDPEKGQIDIASDTIISPLRRRFTLAHELGHALMHFEAAARNFIYNRSEREADLFAANFLMPEDSVRRFFSERYQVTEYAKLKQSTFRGTPGMPRGRFETKAAFAQFVARAPGPGGEPSFAEVFGVSKLAAEKRLYDLRLLDG